MNDHAAVRPVPPGSTAQRELLSVIVAALTLPSPATEKDEVTHVRNSRDRVRRVLYLRKRLLADREADDRDLMTEVGELRGEIQQLPADDYDHNALEF